MRLGRLVRLAGLGGALAAPAAGGVVEDCVQSADRELQVAACTEAIESGRWSGAELAWAFGNRANAWAAMQDPARAVADYGEALERDPAAAATWHNRGLVYAALGDWARAIADYDAALARDPDYAPALGSRGVARRELGQHAAALEDLDRAVALDGGAARHYQNRANVRCALGDVEGSVADRLEAIGRGQLDAGLVQRALAEKGYYGGKAHGTLDDAARRALSAWTRDGCP